MIERCTGGFSGKTLKYVIDKRVKDRHCLVGNTSIRATCESQVTNGDQSRLTLVDVGRVSLLAELATLLLFVRSLGSWLGRCFLRSLRPLSRFGRSLGGSRGYIVFVLLQPGVNLK